MAKNKAAQTLGRKGGKARAARMSKKQRSDAAREAVKARWAKATASFPIVKQETREPIPE